MISLDEYRSELLEAEEVELLDVLRITTPDLVERFDDRVEETWEDSYNDNEDDIEEEDE